MVIREQWYLMPREETSGGGDESAAQAKNSVATAVWVVAVGD